ncbi:MAG: M24 family metallopeptidase, partial [Nitrososphaeria archaeon]
YDTQRRYITAASLDKIVREYILSQGYPSIPHSLGHGIGIQVHEPPALSPTSKDKLTDGMVFSIEPGIYLPDRFGIRIEDIFAIQNSELTKLTNSSSSLIQI